MFPPPSVSKSTSARAKGSQRPRQGNAKQKRQAESSPGPGGARPHCAITINLAWPSMELKRITPMRKGRLSLCHKRTRHKLSPVHYRLWENAAWRSGCGLFLLCPASEELSPLGAQTQSTSSPPFIQLKLSHYQRPHISSPDFQLHLISFRVVREDGGTFQLSISGLKCLEEDRKLSSKNFQSIWYTQSSVPTIIIKASRTITLCLPSVSQKLARHPLTFLRMASTIHL
jgi:hypothetical protein